MKLKILSIILLMMVGVASSAQEQGGQRPPRMERPSAFELADQVRKDISVSDKEFSKIVAAYEKYVKTIFGESNRQTQQPQGPRPGGGPGGMRGQGGPGGHGGPGGMGPRGDRRDGDFGNRRGDSKMPHREMTEDMEKFQKNMKKADEKLDKTIKKLFKKSPDKYNRWLELNTRQRDRLFPHRPGPQATIPE